MVLHKSINTLKGVKHPTHICILATISEHIFIVYKGKYILVFWALEKLGVYVADTVFIWENALQITCLSCFDRRSV